MAASVLMRIIYGARAARWDLLKVVQMLASRVTKWSRECDCGLHRLVCYPNVTTDWVLRGFVGADPSALRLHLYADADFAGDIETAKSTTGAYLCIAGPNTLMPISTICRKQTCVCHSSTEAEVVAAEHALRTEGLQLLTFWDIVFKLFSKNAGGRL